MSILCECAYHRLKTVTVKLSRLTVTPKYLAFSNGRENISTLVLRIKSVSKQLLLPPPVSITYHRLFLSTASETFFHEEEEGTVSTPIARNTPQYLYQNDENNNAEAYLRNNPDYTNTFFNSTLVDDTKLQSTVHRLVAVAQDKKHTIEPVISPINKGIIGDVLSSLRLLKNEELDQVLHSLSFFFPCNSPEEPEYVKIWSQLDEECLSRMTSWNLDRQFLVADLWHDLKLVRFSKFHKKLIAKCLTSCDSLKKNHFMRFLFCLSLTRTMPSSIAACDIERYLNNVANSLNSHEVSIVAMTYFKTETAVRDHKLLEKLLQIVIRDKSSMNSIDVAAVAKFARLSSTFRSQNTLYNLQEAFLPEIHRLSIMACTHLALVGTRNHFPCMDVVNAAINKIFDNIQKARLKELERITLAMTMFDADCDKLGHRIVDELRRPERREEIKEYGRCLPAILHYLSMREIFPMDLIDHVLGESFRKKYYHENNSDSYQRELLCLDFCVELEIPEYKGSRLCKETRLRLLQSHLKRTGSKPRVSAYETSLQTVSKMMGSFLGGFQYFYVCNVLPQHQSIKIVFCTDKNDENVTKVPTAYRALPDHDIKYTSNFSPNTRFHVLYLCNRNDFIIDDNRLTGPGKMQVRQLTKMGYSVHVVLPPFSETVVYGVLQTFNKPVCK